MKAKILVITFFSLINFAFSENIKSCNLRIEFFPTNSNPEINHKIEIYNNYDENFNNKIFSKISKSKQDKKHKFAKDFIEFGWFKIYLEKDNKIKCYEVSYRTSIYDVSTGKDLFYDFLSDLNEYIGDKIYEKNLLCDENMREILLKK